MLGITRVKYREYLPENSTLVAKCTIVINDSLMVHDIEIHECKKGGYYVSMPRRGRVGIKESRSIGRTGDVIHPLTKSLSDEIDKVVLDGYNFYLDTGKASYYPQGVQRKKRSKRQWEGKKYLATTVTH